MKENFVEWKNGLSRSARVGLVSGVLVIVGLLAVLSYWVLSPAYQVLFSDLDPQDGSVIIAELERMKIPYQLADGGRSILIDQDQVYKTRLKLMGKGVNLKGTVGFEIFNESEFGMTDFAQKINYQRALQGEIARTIMGLDEVMSARVHLTIPETGLLKKGDGQAKASITVATKAGQTLNKEQVSGIQRMVAAAIPQIEPSAVTILDSRGVALTKASSADDQGVGNAEGRLGLKQQTENYLTQKVVVILDRALGPGRAIVSVDVTLDHNQVKITREDVVPVASQNADPNGAVKSFKQQTKTNRQGRRAAEAASLQLSESLLGTETMSDSTEETEYLHGRKVEQIIGAPGSIKHLSVGVILPAEIGEVKLDKLSKVIEMAVGLNPSRGDALAMYSVDRGQLSPVVGAIQAEGIGPAEVPDATTGHAAPTAASGESILLVLAAIVIFSLVVGALVFSRKTAAPRLSEQDRQRVLADIQSWLQSSGDKSIRSSEA